MAKGHIKQRVKHRAVTLCFIRRHACLLTVHISVLYDEQTNLSLETMPAYVAAYAKAPEIAYTTTLKTTDQHTALAAGFVLLLTCSSATRCV